MRYLTFLALLTAAFIFGLNVLAQEPAGEVPEAPAADPSGEAAGEAPVASDPSQDRQFNSCMECHTQMGAEYAQMVEEFKGSVHREMDFTCVDCHGGDPTSMDIFEAKSPEAGFVGKPDRASIPEFCAKCHSDQQFMKRFGNIRTDQLSLYKTSVHGQMLYGSGDTNVAVCTDCHTAHNILRVKNPESSVHKKQIPDTCGVCHSDEAKMKPYGLDYNIPSDFKASEHGKRIFEFDDLGAPVCNDCHGNHGATPPGVGHIEDVCGNCHLKTEKYYNNSAHAPAFEDMGLNKCLVCHNQHALQKPTDNYLDAEADANCVMCHTDDTPEYGKITAMMDTITEIKSMHEEAEVLVEDTEHTTHLSMHEMIPRVEQVRTHLLTARILQHSTDVEEMQTNLEEAKGQFDEIKAFTVKLLERSKFNKKMVALLAVLLIAFGFLLLLYRKFVLDIQFPWQPYEGSPLDKR